MKTIKLTSLLIAFVLTSVISVINTSETVADPGNPWMCDYNTEHQQIEIFIAQFKDLTAEPEIKIYSDDNSLIASGSSENIRIRQLISRSDLLAEVNNTHYYKLSYEQPVNAEYQLAAR